MGSSACPARSVAPVQPAATVRLLSLHLYRPDLKPGHTRTVWAARAPALAPRELRITFRQRGQFELSPWPFRERAVDLELRQRLIARLRFADRHELRAACAQAPVRVERLQLGPADGRGASSYGCAGAETPDRKARMSTDPVVLAANKRAAVGFFELAFNHHQPEDAVARYMAEPYVQHNPQAGDGMENSKAAIRGLCAQFPELHLDIKRVIAAQDLVLVHHHLTLTPGEAG